MAIEPIRGCGHRKVGGLYLEGEYVSAPCDRLPLNLEVCPVCGQGIKVSRGFTEINPCQLWGHHIPCDDRIKPCFVCQPLDEVAYIMRVGEKYYSPKSFMEEATNLGVSKRIPFIPKKFKVGETIIYLAHAKAGVKKDIPVLQQAMNILEEYDSDQPRLLEAEKEERCTAIFCSFIPQRIVKLIWEHQADEKTIADLKKRGITPKIIPNGDVDHAEGKRGGK